MDDAIRRSIDTYDDLYGPYTEKLGYRFRLVHLEDLQIATGGQPIVQHKEFGNILAQDAAAYVGLIHPDQQKEKKQESLYRLIAASSTVRLLNYTSKFPMVCKDKFLGVHIARECGLRVLPTVLLGTGPNTNSDVHFAEKTLEAYPMFIRPRDLTAGLGRKTIREQAVLRRFLESPPFPGRTYILQPAVSIKAEFRVYLEGLEIVACRKLEPGGPITSCTIPDDVRDGSRNLARHLETTYLCVDWLWDGSEYWFCEFETGGGFKDLDESDRDRVAAAFFRKLAK